MSDDIENSPSSPPPGRAYEILPPGTRLGPFTLGDAPAYGILGTLYNATRDDGTPISLFVLPRILSDDDRFLRHFREFKDRQFRMSHDRILPMSESQIIDDRICFCGEPVSGRSIPDMLGAAGIYPTVGNPHGVIRVQPSEAAAAFTPDVVLRVTRQTLEAFEYAHSLGILHLSFTPSNILLLDNGDIRLLGFGIFGGIGKEAVEMLVSAGIPPVSLGPRNVRLNIADILSPEVQLDREPDARADIYALGMSAYWMLTGLKPAANYRPPSSLVPALDPGWDIFLARCLARDPANRYPNAKAALRDLENLSSLATQAYADEHTRKKSGGRVKAIARTPGGRIAIAVTVIAILGAGAAGGFLYGEQRSLENRGAVRLRPPRGTLEIATKPGAQLTVNELSGARKSLGVAGTDGVVVVKLPPGRYTLTAVMKGGKPATVADIELQENRREKRVVTPEDAPGQLVFPSLPGDVAVRIDGVDTDVAAVRSLTRDAGKKIVVEAVRPHYRPVRTEITLGSGERREVVLPPFVAEQGRIVVNPLFSHALPTAAQLAGLSVMRSDDGRELPWKDAGSLPAVLPVGNYLVKLSHPDYEPFMTAFEIADNRTTTLNADLVAKPAPFELVVRPDGVRHEFSINGTRPSGVPETIPAETPIEIRVAARDYEDFVTTVVAKPGRPVRVVADLRKIGAPTSGKPFVAPYLGTRFVWIPAGETGLGTPANEPGHTSVEEPATFAKFTRGFWMSRTEVTQAEYVRLTDRNPSLRRGPDLPVDSVSHEDAMRYCKALTTREYAAGRLPSGYEYRLPTEIEWEYACRAGGAASADPAYKSDGPAPAGAAPENAYGLTDMRGNVREWILEPYKDHLPGGRRTDYVPRVAELAGDGYFARGGSWKLGPNEARPGYRPLKGTAPLASDDDLGFRVVLAPAPAP